MPSKRSAVAALQKLEADRLALDQKKKKVEAEAALELGRVLLGTGLENFSKKALVSISSELGKLGERKSLERVFPPTSSQSDSSSSA
jgi:hypothetical protein